MASTGGFAEHLATAQEQLRRFADAPLLHFINGKPAAGVSGATFENHSPVDGALLGEVAAGDVADVDAASSRGTRRVRRLGRPFGCEASEGPAGGRRPDRASGRRDRARSSASIPVRPIRFMSAAAIRGAENFRFFADHAPDAVNGRSMPDVDHLNYSMRRADRPGRRDHAVEHTVHVVDMEDRPGPGRRLHRRAQAGRVEPVHGGDAGRDRASRRACRRAC